MPPIATHDSADSEISTTGEEQAPAVPAVERVSVTTTLVFQVESVEQTEPPGGGQGQDWHRYVLKNQSSTITGVRRGSRQNVRDYAADYAKELNARIVFGPPSWNPRGRKPARAT